MAPTHAHMLLGRNAGVLPVTAQPAADPLTAYLAYCRALALDEIRALIPSGAGRAERMYRLILDYPLREAKGLRPALAIATCRAFGGRLEGVLRTAAVLELFHNAFLVHDDIEDLSERRRGRPTLHAAHGVPVAINVGDAMLSMTLDPLLENTALLGLGPALEILEAIGHMARQTVEGQAIELDWVSGAIWQLSDDDYIDMVVLKTGWYSFITPVTVGAVAAGVPAGRRAALVDFARALAVAFQIQDDVLNLVGDEGATGKERAGDLWEGKRTLLLLHAMRAMNDEDRARAEGILARPRPTEGGLDAVVAELVASGELTVAGAARLRGAQGVEPKRAEEVAWLLEKVLGSGAVAHARAVAATHAEAARAALELALDGVSPSGHAEFLRALVGYVATRSR